MLLSYSQITQYFVLFLLSILFSIQPAVISYAITQLIQNLQIKATQLIIPMQNFVRRYPAPFIAKIHQDYSLEMWRGRRMLLDELHACLWQTDSRRPLMGSSNSCAEINPTRSNPEDQLSWLKRIMPVTLTSR